MSAVIPMETVWGLAGGRGLSFYAEVIMKDGTKHHINKGDPSKASDAFSNFDIPRVMLDDT
jgi:hypothetical protein